MRVQPDAPERGPVAVAAGPRPAVALAVAAVTIDGVVEDAWQDVPLAPPLLPLSTGRRPPRWRARVAVVDGGLVVTMPTLPPKWTSTWTLDPDGTRTTWTVVNVDARHARGLSCTLVDVAAGDVPEGGVHVIPSRAAPCGPVPVTAAQGDEAWEIALPSLAPTRAARLSWTVQGPEDRGGTWSRGGKPEPWPELGRGVVAGGPSVRASASHDAVTDRWTVTVVPGDDFPPTACTWARSWLGQPTDGGDVPLVGGTAAAVAFAGDGLPDAWWTLTCPPAADSLLPRTWPVRLDVRPDRLWLVTPVVDDGQATLRFDVAADRTVPLVVTDARGRPLQVADVALPAGTGRVDVTLVPGAAALVVDGLLSAQVVVVRPDGAATGR